LAPTISRWAWPDYGISFVLGMACLLMAFGDVMVQQFRRRYSFTFDSGILCCSVYGALFVDDRAVTHCPTTVNAVVLRWARLVMYYSAIPLQLTSVGEPTS